MGKKSDQKTQSQESRNTSQDLENETSNREDGTSNLDESLEQQLSEAKDQLARARADYANLENRVRQQQSQFATITTASILSKFVFVLDNLKMAAKHLDDTGLNMVVDQTEKLLEDEGVTKIDVEGEEFDPQTMECVDKVKGDENKVIKLIQTGYKLNSHVIRPAQVHVGSGEQN